VRSFPQAEEAARQAAAREVAAAERAQEAAACAALEAAERESRTAWEHVCATCGDREGSGVEGEREGEAEEREEGRRGRSCGSDGGGGADTIGERNLTSCERRGSNDDGRG